MNEQDTPARQARRLYGQGHQGVLSTISRSVGGYPFGSVVTFATDRDNAPTILISAIAEHTRNIQADHRVSLIVTEPGDDAQALGRLTLIGDAHAVASNEAEDIAARYSARFPHTSEYWRAHDFHYYRIALRRLRFINGFGRIHWLNADELLLRNPFDAVQEERMIAHMNGDHVDAMRDYCRLHGVDAGDAAPRMAAIDSEGFDLMLEKRLLRIPFDAPVKTAEEVRKAMVALARRARESAAAT